MRLLCILLLVIVTEAKKRLKNFKQNKPVPTDDYDDFNPGVDVFEKKYALPVPFGHINNEGYEDPTTALKQPVDLLELELRYPKNPEEEAMLLQTANPRRIQKIAKEPEIVGSPRDEYMYNRDNKDESGGGTINARNDSLPQWLDLPTLQLRNIVAPTKPKMKKKVVTDVQVQREVPKAVLDAKPKMEYFDEHSFAVPNRRVGPSRRINWTTCDEFGTGANFHPKDIVDIPWVPFFYWSKKRFTYVYVHTFTFPKKKEVKFYKDEIGKYLNITLDWNQPKLILKFTIEMLLIAADRKGLFDAIPRLEVPDYVKQNRVPIPTQRIRLKTVGPYLAIMHCKYNSAKIMAVSGEEPPTPGRKLSEAKILNFRGRGNPVSRNLELEEMSAKAEQEAKLSIEKNKFINIDEPMPPLLES